MSISDALVPWLQTNPGTYQAANPTTTPDDYRLLIDAISKMPERPTGQVRILENDPGINGRVNADDMLYLKTGKIQLAGAPEIHISRQGPNFKSRDPWKIAGTLHHENKHLQGASESEAREFQRQFITDAMTSGKMKKDKPYLTAVTRAVTDFKEKPDQVRRLIRDADMEQAMLLEALRK